MDEVEQNSVEDQVAPDTTQEEVQAPQAVAEDRQDKNWRQMREQQKELLRELKMQRELNEKLIASHAPKEVDEFDSISDEEYIPKGQVKKLVTREAQRIAQHAAQEQAERMLRERDQSLFMHKLKTQFSDFDEVVNQETLSLLEETDPDLAMTIAELKDPYKIGLQSYKYIKALNIADQVPQKRRVKEVEKKLDKNSKTVQSPQAYDKRPMAQAFKMTENEKNVLYQEMMGYASQAGFGY